MQRIERRFLHSPSVGEGFEGTESGRLALVAELQTRILAKFIEEPEFAARIGESDDRRVELNAHIKRLREEIGH